MMVLMKRTYIGDLKDHIETEAAISGWIDVVRDQGKMVFFDFRDMSGKVQGVVLPGNDELLATARETRPEWVVTVTGNVNKRPEKMVKEGIENGDIELEIKNIEIISRSAELPFDRDADLNMDTLLDHRPLTLRRPRERAIFKVQNEIIQAYRDFLLGEKFTEFEAPKLVGEDAEGGGNIFKLEYFYEKYAYLATSPQLYKQIMVGVFERVFSIGNVFRAEKHATTRHLNEYTSLDVEFGFITDHTDIMKLEMRLLRFMFERLKERCAKEFELLDATFPQIPEGDFPIMKLREAQKLITEKTGTDCTNEPDLEPEHERWLCEYSAKELGSDFIFITHYPVSKRPFYTYEDENDPGFTKSFDLLFRGIEITTGGQRIHDHDVLIEKLKEKGLDPKRFEFYLSTFKYGMPPHGGWGMGLERLTEKFLGFSNVREATLFPRDINRIDERLSKENEE